MMLFNNGSASSNRDDSNLQQSNDQCERCGLGGELVYCETCNPVFRRECIWAKLIKEEDDLDGDCSVATASTQAQLRQMVRRKERPNLLSKRLKDTRLRVLWKGLDLHLWHKNSYFVFYITYSIRLVPRGSLVSLAFGTLTLSLNLSCIAQFLDATTTTTICAYNTAAFSTNHESGKILLDCYSVILSQPSLKDLLIFMTKIEMFLFLSLKPTKEPTPPPTYFPTNFPTRPVSCVVISLYVFGSQINVLYILE